MTTTVPAPQAGTGPSQGDGVARAMVVRGDAYVLGRMRKVANIRGWTVYCDEGPIAGGDDSAPKPLDYFAASILF